MVVDELLVVVFKGLPRDRVQQPFVEQTKLLLQFFTLVKEVLVEVFKASPQDRAQQRLVVQTTSFLQLFTLVKDVLVEVYKALPRDRAQQWFVEQISSFLLLLKVVLEVLGEVFQTSPEDRAHQRFMSPDSVLRSRTSTSQLPVSVPVVHGVLRSRMSTFLFVSHALMVVFKVPQLVAELRVPPG